MAMAAKLLDESARTSIETLESCLPAIKRLAVAIESMEAKSY